MSLRVFHIVFVIFSILLCLGVGAWGISQYATSHVVWGIPAAVAAVLASCILAIYALRVWRKLKAISLGRTSVFLNMFILFLVTVVQSQAVACPSCYGDPESSAAEGMNAAILLLFGVTGSVVGGVVAFFLAMRKRSVLARLSSLDNTTTLN